MPSVTRPYRVAGSGNIQSNETSFLAPPEGPVGQVGVDERPSTTPLRVGREGRPRGPPRTAAAGDAPRVPGAARTVPRLAPGAPPTPAPTRLTRRLANQAIGSHRLGGDAYTNDMNDI